jgi:hypothetical protein
MKLKKILIIGLMIKLKFYKMTKNKKIKTLRTKPQISSNIELKKKISRLKIHKIIQIKNKNQESGDEIWKFFLKKSKSKYSILKLYSTQQVKL